MPSTQTDRLVATIGMMGASTSAGDAEAVNALRMATRMLEGRGLTWRDVAERAFTGRAWSGMVPENDGATPRGNQPIDPEPMRGSPFADIFDDMTRSAFGPGFRRPGGFGSPPPRDPPRRHKARLAGADVPDEICGTVRVVDADRSSRNGPMLVLDVEGDAAVHGPLVCFSEALQAELK